MEPLDPTPGQAPPPPPAPPASAEGNPWERRSELGFFQGLVDAVKGFITNPGDTFAATRRSGDLLSPLLYAVIVGFIASAVAMIWQAVMGTSWTEYVPPDVQDQLGLGATALASTGGMIAWVLIAPVFIVIGLFIVAAILHLSLMVVGGLKQSGAGFEGTLRSLSYSHTANLANVIPVIGGPIAFIWSIALTVIGFMRLHQTSGGRAIIAVALPLVLCCVCVILVFMMGIAGLAAAMGGN